MKLITILLATMIAVLAGASIVDAQNTSEEVIPVTFLGVDDTHVISITVVDDAVTVEGASEEGYDTFSYSKRIENRVNELYMMLAGAVGAFLLTLRAWWKNKTKAQKTALVSDVIAAMDDGKVTSDEAVKMIKTHL